MTLKHWYQILFWRSTSLEDPSFLEVMEKIQRAMCNIKGNFMNLIFDRKNFIELSEWLHEFGLKNNEVIHKLTIQNEQLLEKLQDTCFSSYVRLSNGILFWRILMTWWMMRNVEI